MLTPESYAAIREYGLRDCVFCAPPPELVLYKGTTVSALFDISPLVPGHLILHTNAHHGCVGEVPAHEHDELVSLHDHLWQQVRSAYGKVMSFEHGRAGHCLPGPRADRLCHHAHVHVLPVDVDLDPPLRALYPRVPARTPADLATVFDEYGGYLHVRRDQSWAYPAETTAPHLLRTLVATALGHPERADWRSHADLDAVNEAITAYRC
ncbi:HIT domain-containing protein [Lentzea sp. NPDC051838]|uniref:HIT family protein n=1 Tax=Lentzea sp. NPDC051838 TaxID=3154849 RepID=UPI003446C750